MVNQRSHGRKPKDTEGTNILTTQQTADRLGLSQGAVKKMIYRRQITFVKIGRSVRIPENEIDRLIQANVVPRRAELATEAR
jgi:excisionase family DNA binding protein